MTWLPRLVQEIRAAYPDVLIEPQIGPGALLHEQLMKDERYASARAQPCPH